ncbi:MAG: aminoacyl-tRNA hydrolase [Candidatus Margulisbacteria bacterium]|nr:aminoacyl-tRNA hydrolase [Candidatus Margulisiibacteriota bacterium]
MFLVVGLGNPGLEYEATRHNLGFKVVAELAGRLGIKTFKEKHQSFLAETNIAGHKVILAQPQTFMNNSGLAVHGILAWHKIEAKGLIVVYDDVDLEVGQIRIREKGSAGGHHGLESIIASLGTTEFARVRLGIGRESLTGDVSDYVLQRIPPTQREPLAEAVMTAADAVEAIIKNGLAPAMNKFNGA